MDMQMDSYKFDDGRLESLKVAGRSYWQFFFYMKLAFQVYLLTTTFCRSNAVLFQAPSSRANRRLLYIVLWIKGILYLLAN